MTSYVDTRPEWASRPLLHVIFCVHIDIATTGPLLPCFMMTSSNGNIFRVTGPLCGEFTGQGNIFWTFSVKHSLASCECRKTSQIMWHGVTRPQKVNSNLLRSFWCICVIWSSVTILKSAQLLEILQTISNHLSLKIICSNFKWTISQRRLENEIGGVFCVISGVQQRLCKVMVNVRSSIRI